MTVFLKGMDETLERLNDRLRAIDGSTLKGFLTAGLKVQRLAQQRVPVEYGKLKASAYTRKHYRLEQGSMAVEIGFSALYAIFVHENMEAKLYGQERPSGKGDYWGPHGQPKFLESAVRELQDEIVKTVADEAKQAGKRA